jgi:hypothetical protein
MNRCRRSLIVLVAGCLISHGQQQEPPTFRATTTLVEFTLVALDGKGRPIADLKKEEVSVSEGGNSRQLADFRFEGAGLAGAAAATVATRRFFKPARAQRRRGAAESDRNRF